MMSSMKGSVCVLLLLGSCTNAVTGQQLPPWVLERTDRLELPKGLRETIRAPLAPGTKPQPEPPTRDEVLQAVREQLVQDQGKFNPIHSRIDDLRFVITANTSNLGVPCFFPLVGPASLYQESWTCTVHYRERLSLGPFQREYVRRGTVSVCKDRLYLLSRQQEEQHAAEERANRD